MKTGVQFQGATPRNFWLAAGFGVPMGAARAKQQMVAYYSSRVFAVKTGNKDDRRQTGGKERLPGFLLRAA